MKEYFKVNVSKYTDNKNFDVVRPASLNNPKDNAVMFIMEKNIEQAYVFKQVCDCLIFWPSLCMVPDEVAEKHVIISCERPHREYCRFFKNNNITYLPKKEQVQYIDGAWIAEGAMIGTEAVIFPGAYISGECRIGNHVFIGSGVKLIGEIEIGNNVVIRENTVVGADGLTTDRDADGRAITMPQFGKVILEDDVQIGANVTIARGAIDETRICRRAKIDSGAFISHNVQIDEDSFVVGETIMFGSSSVGKKCLISGNSTIMNTVSIGDESIVGAGAVVTKSVPEKTVVKGNPAR